MNDVRRFQAVDRDTSCDTINFECVRLTVLVEVLVWDDMQDLQDPTKAVVRSPKMKANGAA
jgi:hypothetical protein